MRCSHCGICCEKTEMLLAEADIKCLEKAGYTRKKFVCYDKKSFAKLQNHRGYCVFYDTEKRRCKVYEYRPVGCRVYPVIYSIEEGVIIDDLCPMKNTVSTTELKRKGKGVMKLLQKIDEEAKTRVFHTKPTNNLK